MAITDEWVQLHRIILEPQNRSSQVPEDTKNVPLEMWVKGYLQVEAEVGDQVEIKTVTNRRERGTLVQINPVYQHSFGEFVPEVIEIHKILEKELRDGE